MNDLLQKKLQKVDQQQLLDSWETLSSAEQETLYKQVSKLDIDLLEEQRKTLQTQNQIKQSRKHTPLIESDRCGNSEDKKRGQKLLAEGKVGALIVAGGQGTRFGSSGPKGAVSLSIVKGKSLFQLVAEKTIAASKQAGRPLMLALMTSPLNDAQTRQFFAENNLFGLKPEQLSFFSQNTLPCLDGGGNLFFSSPGVIAQAPNGNGDALSNLYASETGNAWEQKGISLITFGQIDNPLADPFDAELLGYHQRKKNEITVKCIEKETPEESVGILVQKGRSIRVVEYFELTQEEKQARTKKGTLQYSLANCGQFCFSAAFAKKRKVLLPFHLAKKTAERYHNGQRETIQVWKYERFIFDLFPYAENVGTLLYPRESCFAPLKNKEGANGLTETQQALLNQDRRQLQLITGEKVPQGTIELDQQFYYPTEELKQRWKGKIVLEGYISSGSE